MLNKKYHSFNNIIENDIRTMWNSTKHLFGNSPRTRRGRDKSSKIGRGVGIFMKQGIISNNASYSQTSNKAQPQSTQYSQQFISKKQELKLLKQQVQSLQRHVDSILHRINELNTKKQNTSDKELSVKASIIIEKCIGCGICLDFCNRGAITLDNVAKIDLEKCNGCGTCIDVCPNQAIVLK